VGAFLAEFVARRDPWHAGRAGVGAWIGHILGIASKAVLVFLMISVFVAAYVL
jgi:uncharacterized protein YqgC (DUF456 family)